LSNLRKEKEVTRRLYTVVVLAVGVISPPVRARTSAPEAWIGYLVDDLAEFRPHVSVCGPRLEVTVTVEADDASWAGKKAETLVTDWLNNNHIPYDRLLLEQVINDNYLQEQLNDLIGLMEVAELLGVSQQRASQLSRDPGFPGSIRNIAGRAVWSRKEVEHFMRHDWSRKRGPRKTVTPVGSSVPG